MKNTTILILLTLSFFINLNAQEKFINDTNRRLINTSLVNINSAKNIEDKISAYADCGYNYRVFANKDDSSIYYLKKGFDLLESTENPKSWKRLSYNLAGMYRKTGFYSDAIDIYLNYLRKLQNQSDTLKVNVLYQISQTYREAKDYKNQLIWGIKFNSTYEKIRLNEKYFINNTIGVSGNAVIGDAYLHLNILDSALYFFNKDYELYTSILIKNKNLANNLFGIGIPIINLGEIYSRMGENEIALQFFRKALNSINNIEKDGAGPELCREMSMSFKKINQLDSALYFAKLSYSSVKYFEGLGYLVITEKAKTSKYLSELYNDMNKKDSAFKYQSIYLNIQDSIFNTEKISNLQITTLQENLRQEKIKEEQKKAIIEREKNLILSAIGFFIPIFISLIFLIGKWYKNKFKFIVSLGIASLLMLFEFISLLIHPYIEKITHHNVVLMYIILLIIASFLVPLHHKMEQYIKKTFNVL
jgi:tetratricopeptide (TPR) repeat protein